MHFKNDQTIGVYPSNCLGSVGESLWYEPERRNLKAWGLGAKII